MEDQSPPSSPAPVPVAVEPVVLETVVAAPVEPITKCENEKVETLEMEVKPDSKITALQKEVTILKEWYSDLKEEVPVPLVQETAPVVPAPVPATVPAPVVPAPVPATVVQETVPAPVVSKALVKIEPIDALYNKMILNSSLLSAISDLKTNGFTNASIPLLILSVMATYNSYTAATPAHALGTDDIQVLMERVYNYFVEKYDLIDTPHRLAMYNLFDASL